MSEPPWDRILHDPSEHRIRHWPADSTRPDGEADRSGWLIVTDRRLLFVRRGGWLSRNTDIDAPEVALRLETVRQIELRQFQMRIGYGDRFAIPGLTVDGHTFRFSRDTPAEEVRRVLEQAVRSCRPEPGRPRTDVS